MKQTKLWFVKVWVWEVDKNNTYFKDKDYLMVITDNWEKVQDYVRIRYGQMSNCAYYGSVHPKQNYKSVIIT